MSLLPTTSGAYETKVGPKFLNALSDRVQSGLLMGSEQRNQYEVVHQDKASLSFRSTNLWTGIGIGLNDVTVSVDQKTGHAHFEIKYWTWAKYVIGLSASIFLIMALLFTVGQSVLPAPWFDEYNSMPAVAWSFLIFFGLIFPWIMIALHKNNARQCLVGVFDELNS